MENKKHEEHPAVSKLKEIKKENDSTVEQKQPVSIAELTVQDLFLAAKAANVGALTFIVNTGLDENGNDIPDKAIIILDGANETQQIVGLVEEETAKWGHSVSTKDVKEKSNATKRSNKKIKS